MGNMDDFYSLNPAQIVMYSTQYCSDCLRAKAFFEANNIPFVPILLEGNPAATDFVLKMNNGYRSVPTIVFPDGTVLVEPSWQELREKMQE
jgi:mycoredoxin